MAEQKIICTGDCWGEPFCTYDDCPFHHEGITYDGKKYIECSLSYDDNFKLEKGNVITITETPKEA